MSCAEVGELLQHYLDGELDESRADRLADHLEHCLRCGLEADTYIEIKVSLARRAAPLPPASVERLRRFGATLAEQGEP